jgi:small subunit ribosomal protein S20
LKETDKVAHSLSAKKRVRQTEKRNARNRARKADLREKVKAFSVAIHKGDATAAADALNKTVQKLDRMAVQGTLHRNTASRKRSRLAKRLNALSAGGKGTPAATA